MDTMVGGDTGLDRVEEDAEFAYPMTREAAADDVPHRRFQGCEQQQCAWRDIAMVASFKWPGMYLQ